MENERNNEENQSSIFDETNNTKIKQIIDKKCDKYYYIPICREEGCNGNLNIFIDEQEFIVNGICDKNNNHKYNNIYFEIFEKFYLKENFIQACFNCTKNIENKDKFECKECKKIYCSSCFISDDHIQKNLKNLNVIKNEYLEDKRGELICYCSNSKEKIGIYCLNNNRENNDIINIIEKIPSKNQLQNLKEKIIKKTKAFDSLIKSINEWQIELNKKKERIKQNLKNEIKLIEKLFLNFNSDYMNYTYYLNFHKFFEYIEDYNNDSLKNFMKTNDFKQKTKYIFDLLLESKITYYKAELEKFLDYRSYFILENLTNNSFLLYTYDHSYLKLFIKNEISNSFTEKSNIYLAKKLIF